jgi:hypothetical protein
MMKIAGEKNLYSILAVPMLVVDHTLKNVWRDASSEPIG